MSDRTAKRTAGDPLRRHGAIRRRVEHLMGMPISLALRGRHADDDHAAATWHEILEGLRAVDRVFSTYREDSYISRLGRGELAVGDCPPAVGEVLELGEAARLQSGGAFDVRHIGTDGRRLLDPSGVVKGWAVQRASVLLHALAETDFCLSAGGDIVCGLGDPEAPTWQIGIEDPFDPTRIVARIPVRQGAVATSGYTHRGAHIVDARSGKAPHGIASVTVVAENLTLPTSTAPPHSPSEREPSTGSTRDPVDMGLSCGRTGRRRSISPGAENGPLPQRQSADGPVHSQPAA